MTLTASDMNRILGTPEHYPTEGRMEKSFSMELQDLLNRYSKENASSTPDYVLCGYILDCLRAFNSAVNSRECWHVGKTYKPEEPISPDALAVQGKEVEA